MKNSYQMDIMNCNYCLLLFSSHKDLSFPTVSNQAISYCLLSNLLERTIWLKYLVCKYFANLLLFYINCTNNFKHTLKTLLIISKRVKMSLQLSVHLQYANYIVYVAVICECQFMQHIKCICTALKSLIYNINILAKNI